jgi:hypothetical protein
MSTAQWFIVIALAIVMDAGLGAAEPGEGQGVLGIKGRNGAADALDGIPEETALTPDDGSAALKLVERALGCGTNSFDGATPVLMADGHTRPISAIRVGDRIVATDPATGTTSPHTVTALHLNQDTDLTNLTVTDSQHHTAVIHTTQHHPFYDDTLHAWVDASKLHPGDKLHPVAGEPVTVRIVTNFISSRTMYNLTIETDHTYYVVAGKVSVLVHNCELAYENPGHHDPIGGPNPYNPTKAVLPADAEAQFRNSQEVNGVRWTKIGSGKRAVYYRYFNNQNGVWHFSGSSNGVTNRGVDVGIPLDQIPISVRRG